MAGSSSSSSNHPQRPSWLPMAACCSCLLIALSLSLGVISVNNNGSWRDIEESRVILILMMFKVTSSKNGVVPHLQSSLGLGTARFRVNNLHVRASIKAQEDQGRRRTRTGKGGKGTGTCSNSKETPALAWWRKEVSWKSASLPQRPRTAQTTKRTRSNKP